MRAGFTDVKAEINILDTLQFLFVAHMSKSSAKHSDVFLITSSVRKTKSARCVWAGSSRCREFPLIGAVTISMTDPHYINELRSDLRGVKEGWYAIDERGRLLSGPFSNQEICLTRISQSGTDECRR